MDDLDPCHIHVDVTSSLEETDAQVVESASSLGEVDKSSVGDVCSRGDVGPSEVVFTSSDET